MKNPKLIAYIPVLNQRHIDWFKKHKKSHIYLISQETAEKLVPRLSRNMSSLPTEMIAKSIRANQLVENVSIFNPKDNNFNSESWIFPDEDVSHAFAQKYLEKKEVSFEMIWARWDMTAVHKKQPIIKNVTVSTSDLDKLRIQIAQKEAVKSPDWWRQIGAVAFKNDECLAVACNTHLPNEYETYIFGDPRLNVDAGQIGKYCALHAERAVIALCAKRGISLEGTSLYATVFPCEDCAREIVFAGIKKVFFLEGYSVLNAQEVLSSNGVEVIQIK